MKTLQFKFIAKITKCSLPYDKKSLVNCSVETINFQTIKFFEFSLMEKMLVIQFHSMEKNFIIQFHIMEKMLIVIFIHLLLLYEIV